jgi:soluble lytic murein transglycosylase-like protein
MITRRLARPLPPFQTTPEAPREGPTGVRCPSRTLTFLARARRMHTLRGTYVRRGDAARQRARARQVILGVAVGVLAVVLVLSRRLPEARAGVEASLPLFDFGAGLGSQHLRDELNATKGQLDLANAQLERLNAIVGYSSRYRIGADLAGSIYDIALAEGIEPELAFRLVKVESDFNEHASSSAGALGLTQVMPSTAQFFVPGITRDGLYQRETNLRVGLRYLRTLVREYHGDLRLALLVYNRGELAVDLSREQGLDPSNGYERLVMKGYRGTGIIN